MDLVIKKFGNVRSIKVTDFGTDIINKFMITSGDFAGMIFDRYGSIICYPSPKPKIPEFNEIPAGTTLYPIIDGSLVTLYKDHEKNYWCIATANGYDVTPMHYNGPKTYAEVLFDLMHKYPEFIQAANPTLYGGKLGLTLDDNYCYTIGFRHHSFHPIGEENDCIWVVRKTHLSKHNNESMEFSVTYDGLYDIPAHQPTGKIFATVDEIRENDTGLGYIMYVKEQLYIVSTQKHECLKNYFYKPILDQIRSEVLRDGKFIKYNTIATCMNSIKYMQAKQFYPEAFTYYDEIINKVVNCIINILLHSRENEYDEKIKLLADVAMKNCTDIMTVDPHEISAANIIGDLVRCEENIYKFYLII